MGPFGEVIFHEALHVLERTLIVLRPIAGPYFFGFQSLFSKLVFTFPCALDAVLHKTGPKLGHKI